MVGLPGVATTHIAQEPIMRWNNLCSLALATGLAACQSSGPVENTPANPIPSFAVVNNPGDGAAAFEEFEVCKVGSAANFNFSVTDRSNQQVTNGSISLTDGECRVIASFGGMGADVSVTEVVPTGFALNRVDIDVLTTSGTASRTEAGPTVADFIAGTTGGGLRGVLATFVNEPLPPPPGGGQGCTPGYWKQSQHFDSWPAGILPGDLFSAHFEDAFPGKTLLTVVGQGGGGLNALGRHAVAALLNAASSGVDYDMTAQEVIDAFNAVFPGGDYEGQKDVFANLNEQGCPLN